MDVRIIYEDSNLLVVDKPAGISVFPEGNIEGATLIDLIIKKCPAVKNSGEPPRYGVVHRLDKDTSGILLVAKNNESLIFFQNQFKTRGIEKKYIALVIGKLEEKQGIIETLIGRSLKNRLKQKVYLQGEPKSAGKREAITEYRVLENFEDYALLEITPKTGRKHQIRCHLSHINHPIAGDKLYGFKNQPMPKGLTRHFLHASYIRVKLSSGETKKFNSELPKELKKIINNLKNPSFASSFAKATKDKKASEGK